MVNSGATGNFIDIQTAADNGFTAYTKRNIYILLTVDRDTIGSNKGRVTYETEWLLIKIL